MNILILLLSFLGASLAANEIEHPKDEFFVFHDHYFIKFEGGQIVHDPDCPCEHRRIGYAHKQDNEYWYIELDRVKDPF